MNTEARPAPSATPEFSNKTESVSLAIGAQVSNLRGSSPAKANSQDGHRRSAKPATQTVIEKRRWHSPSPTDEEKAAGFSGWRSRGYLPHFDRAGLYQFITFRLADAMPRKRLHEWQALFKIEDELKRRIQVEKYLDCGHGSSVLRDPALAGIVQAALLKFDSTRYRLLGWVVMPNHVHVLIESLNVPLARILHSWKAFTSLQINRALNRSGPLWQIEYFDRYMRDVAHFRKTLRYIENNPVMAGLVQAPADWEWSSARLADSTLDRSVAVQPARRLAEIVLNNKSPSGSNP